MCKLLAAAFIAALSIVVLTGPATADGTDHNCAGKTSSTLAQALGPDFGAAVSAAAQSQLVDNFGLRNCGAANGRNP
jgi:hypothetical protein